MATDTDIPSSLPSPRHVEAMVMGADAFLEMGMLIVGVERYQWYSAEKNIAIFKEEFGATPSSVNDLWSDLREMELLTKKSRPKHLLMTIRFLWMYPTLGPLGRFFKIDSKNTVRKWIHHFVPRIAQVMSKRMVKWKDADLGQTFFMSVDGTCCRIEEPRPFSKIYSCHKFGGHAGVNYEIGMSIILQKLLWVYGPTLPGLHNDLEVARQALLPKLRAYGNGKRIIADGIYGAASESDVVSIDNEFDPREVAEFKERVCSRHEKFNNLLKLWDCLEDVFRHGITFHRECFHAVVAIVCIQLDNGSYSLFDPYPMC
ncbi:hypothetical protein SEMRO_1182_G249960.1 [Seminavis robusta]|uniref:DDE Tnp4 domain-containing protein n=1 Tax=Seminavis robusta TaxID=568900 RepID=A0A9N8EHN0_9STRA|nr:hypothetical protein SEMRO_1182_G249960.1 [Seminavis robusta]|eukprot:Sro1182_g249960.1 n/a (315) ;mRNA; f:18937-19881